jgi:hypothetical protein
MKNFIKHMFQIITTGYQRTELPDDNCCVCHSFGKVTTLPFVGARKFCLNCARSIMR